MSQSLNLTAAESFQGYVQDHYDQLITKVFVNFKSALDGTIHEGVKGRKSITSMVVSDLVRRYSSTFNAIADTHTFSPRNLVVADAKVDMKIVPKDFESSYLGELRKKGQNSMDLPWQQYILDQSVGKIGAEQELAFWRAVAAGTPASTDKLIALFDGIKQILTDEIGNLSPVTTGALTASNAFTSIENVYDTVGSQYQDAGIDCFISPKTNNLAGRQYRADFGKYNDGTNENKSDWGIPGLTVKVRAGVPDNCILIMPAENIHYGFDGAMDASMFNFEQEDRTLKMWLDFKMGVQLGIVDSELIALNEQWTV